MLMRMLTPTLPLTLTLTPTLTPTPTPKLSTLHYCPLSTTLALALIPTLTLTLSLDLCETAEGLTVLLHKLLHLHFAVEV